MKRAVPPDSEQQQQQQRPRTAKEVARSSGLFKDYLSGLDNLRKLVNDKENELAKALNEFYCSDEKDEGAFNEHCVRVNAALEAANRVIGNSGQQQVIVDGQAPVAEMINKLKDSRQQFNPGEILQFWEDFKLALEQLQTIADSFDRDVATKLRNGCLLSSSFDQDKSKLTMDYLADAGSFAKDLEQLRGKIRLISHSAGTHVKLELISKSSHAERVLQKCNDDFYPILCVIPELTVRIEDMMRIASQWLDRDETYLFDIANELRQKRNETREMEQELRAERERHRQLLKSVKSAYLMCQNSRKRLREITSELESLEQQIQTSHSQRKAKLEEKKQKKEMAEFLNISISQTKMNYALQLKRQRLMTQIQELEKFLRQTEQQISELKAEIQTKSSLQKSAEQQRQQQEATFASMRNDLDSFTKKVQVMSNELRTVRHHLSHLESEQSLKTSPEVVDAFFDQPRTVQLAPSLMESINLKKRKLKTGG